MGYTPVTKTDVRVFVNRTITVDFELSETVVEGEMVTVVATREVIQQDVS